MVNCWDQMVNHFWVQMVKCLVQTVNHYSDQMVNYLAQTVNQVWVISYDSLWIFLFLVLGPDGKPMGPNGEAVAVLPEGVKLGPDGKPILGPNGCLMGADGKPLLGPNGELLGPDGKPLLGPNGEMLGPDGKPVLGPGGVALGPDGKPLLGPDGQPLVIGEDEIVAGSAAQAGSAMSDFNFEIDPDELARLVWTIFGVLTNWSGGNWSELKSMKDWS